MADEFMKELKKITAKSVEDLTDWDVAFLRARESYLTGREVERFASVLNIKKVTDVKKILK